MCCGSDNQISKFIKTWLRLESSKCPLSFKNALHKARKWIHVNDVVSNGFNNCIILESNKLLN